MTGKMITKEVKEVKEVRLNRWSKSQRYQDAAALAKVPMIASVNLTWGEVR